MHPQPFPSDSTIAAARRHMTRRYYRLWMEARMEAHAAWEKLDDAERVALTRPTFLDVSRFDRRQLARHYGDDRRLSGGTPHPQGPRSQRRRSASSRG